MYCLGLA
ncbi:hypothetical protein CR513_00844 [Mucuna pruriens]|nr:hypothetical protein CR513_00844 [Mucuna pruriens]